MREMEYMAYMGNRGGPYRVLVERTKETDCFEDLGTDGTLVLKCTF